MTIKARFCQTCLDEMEILRAREGFEADDPTYLKFLPFCQNMQLSCDKIPASCQYLMPHCQKIIPACQKLMPHCH